jgi:hypothetical protein
MIRTRIRFKLLSNELNLVIERTGSHNLGTQLDRVNPLHMGRHKLPHMQRMILQHRSLYCTDHHNVFRSDIMLFLQLVHAMYSYQYFHLPTTPGEASGQESAHSQEATLD